MYCVYWKITGPPVPVLRGVWMYDQVLTLLPTLFRVLSYLQLLYLPRTVL